MDKKKKMYLTVLLSLTFLVGLLLVPSSKGVQLFALQRRSTISNTVLELNHENRPTDSTVYTNAEIVVKTYSTFQYTDVKAAESAHCMLNKNGTIQKKEVSNGLLSIYSSFEGSLIVETGTEKDVYTLKYELASGEATTVYGNYFKITANEETKITSMRFEYSCYVPVSPHEHDLDVHHEMAASEGIPGNLEYGQCKEPGCKKYFLIDCDGNKTECAKDAWVVTEPVLSSYLRSTKYKPSVMTIDRANNVATIDKTAKTSAGALFLTNNTQKTSRVFIETTISVTKDDQYSDYGFFIAPNGEETSASALLRVTFYAAENNCVAKAVRIRNGDDKVVKNQTLSSSIDLSTNKAKLGMYRYGSTIIVYVNDQYLTRIDSIDGWSDASDMSKPVNYGIIAQNTFNAKFEDTNIKFGGDATALTTERISNYSNFDTTSNDSVSWNAKGGKEANFFVPTNEQVSNTYVEAEFSAVETADDQWADLGFIISKPGTSAISNAVLMGTMYIHNPSKLSATKVNSIKLKSYNAKDDSKIGDLAETMRSVTPLGELSKNSVKFGLYRNGSVIKLYLNDQFAYEYNANSAPATSAAAELKTSNSLRYGIWSSNITNGKIENAKVYTGTEADQIVASKVSNPVLTNNIYVGNGYTTRNTDDTGTKISAGGKKIYLNAQKTSENVYFETNIKVATYGAWGMTGIIMEDGQSGKGHEPFQVATSNQSSSTTGVTNQLKGRVNNSAGASSDTKILTPLNIAANTVMNLKIYKSGATVKVWFNNELVYTFDSATSGLTSGNCYYYGVYSDNNSTNAEFSNMNMLVGGEADLMYSLLAK